MKTALKLWFLVAGYCFMPLSFAYDIGGMEVLSSLNEPLEGRISLHGSAKEKKSPVIIDIASKIDFMRHKIRRNYYVSDLKVSMEESPLGEPYIRVQSSEPMMARTIEFLVMMLTSEDESFAKYRFVLPQLKKEDNPPLITQNRLLSSKKRALLARRMPDFKKNHSKPLSSKESKKYKVASGDSLSKIAMKLAKHYPQFKSWRPLMIQLENLNPDAFTNGNINNLKVSTVLRLPVPSGWNQKNVLAASPDKSYKQKNNKVNNYQKIKIASWQPAASEAISKKQKNKDISLLQATSQKKMQKLKKNTRSLISISSYQPKLSYSTLSTMKVQPANSGKYQAQGLFSGAIM